MTAAALPRVPGWARPVAAHARSILENVVSDDAVKDGVHEGPFTLGPSRVTGAVQAIINPIY